MSSPTAADRLASMREATMICALVLLGAMSADPSAAIDALSAIAPASADVLCEELADRRDTTPAELRAGADLYRLEQLELGRRSSSGAAA